MNGLGGDSEGRLRPGLWLTTSLVTLVTMVAVAAARMLHDALLIDDLRTHVGLVIAGGAALFLAAAALRLAVWLLTDEPDAWVRAGATAVLALVLMPVHLWSHSVVDPATVGAIELAMIGVGRVACAVLVIALLLLAITRPRRHDRLVLLAAASWALALGLLVLGVTHVLRPDAMPQVLQALSVVTAVGWAAAAGYAAHRAETRPWALGMAPFLLLMGMTDVLIALDSHGTGIGTTAAMLITLAVAVVWLVGAVADLRTAVHSERRRTAELERDLVTTRDDLVSLQQRERWLAHDARGTLAGVRAAMQIWADDAGSDPDHGSGTAQLRQAALSEVARLEQALREHRVELGCGPVALDVAVSRAVRGALSRGAELRIAVPPLVVLGQATDLELAVREVLDQGLAGDPSRTVALTGWLDGDRAVLELAFAPESATSLRRTVRGDLELARRLVRRQRGDLVETGEATVRLELPLCPPPVAVTACGPDEADLVRVPRQRHSPGPERLRAGRR